MDITDRTLADESLQRSEERNRAILRAIPDLMFLQTADGVYLDYQVRDTRDLLVPPAGFLGKNMRDVLPPGLSESLSSCFRRAQETDEPQVVEYRLTLDGEERWYEARIVTTEGDKMLSVVREITDRKRAEEALQGAQESLTIALEASQMGTWDLDLTRDFSGHRSLRHDQIFGYDTPQAEWGREIAKRHIVEEDRPLFDEAFERAMATGTLDFEARVRWSDGSVHWMAARGRFYFDENGRPTRGAGVNFDISRRRQAEESLRESEERFRNMADNAPVMIWMSGVDKLCTYFNRQWLIFSGRNIEEELGMGWADGVHPEDCKHCIETYNNAFDRREPFTMEYRLRRADREFRWVLDTGTPRFSPTSEFLGYVGSCIDITERKAAEESLEDLSGQLIRAREDECARIARELHDDVSQRMALMSIALEQLGQGAPETNGNMSKQLKQLMNQAGEVSREIHRIARDLHPSKLVYLGLVAAVKSLCDELHQIHKLKIEFSHDGVPAGLSQEISLCLYRIAQECLNNAIKHSGARDAKVKLLGTGDEIVLRVSDTGLGFDPDSPAIKRGLGLVSMKERLRLVRGNISVESRPSQGTQITASVPLGTLILGLTMASGSAAQPEPPPSGR
jgi:PAS domain S-box-containing protein